MADIGYVAARFVAPDDHIKQPLWGQLFDGLGLDEGHGFITCDECNANLHAYSADRGDPGYNENTGDGYIVFGYDTAICGSCIVSAFECIDQNHPDVYIDQ